MKDTNEQIDAEEVKKNELMKSLSEKISLGDKLDDNLRVITQKITQLEKIEYPGENEREMLVSCYYNLIISKFFLLNTTVVRAKIHS